VAYASFMIANELKSLYCLKLQQKLNNLITKGAEISQRTIVHKKIEIFARD
jgi:hypothetical protein